MFFGTQNKSTTQPFGSQTSGLGDTKSEIKTSGTKNNPVLNFKSEVDPPKPSQTKAGFGTSFLGANTGNPFGNNLKTSTPSLGLGLGLGANK